MFTIHSVWCGSSRLCRSAVPPAYRKFVCLWLNSLLLLLPKKISSSKQTQTNTLTHANTFIIILLEENGIGQSSILCILKRNRNKIKSDSKMPQRPTYGYNFLSIKYFFEKFIEINYRNSSTKVYQFRLSQKKNRFLCDSSSVHSSDLYESSSGV